MFFYLLSARRSAHGNNPFQRNNDAITNFASFAARSEAGDKIREDWAYGASKFYETPTKKNRAKDGEHVSVCVCYCVCEFVSVSIQTRVYTCRFDYFHRSLIYVN